MKNEEMLIPIEGSLERIFLERAIELDENGSCRGVTYLDFVGTGITEENIDQVVNNLRIGMYIAENDNLLLENA